MKNKYISLSVLTLTIGLMSFIRSHEMEMKRSKAHFPTGAGFGMSGAPNQDNCSNCHGPEVQSGNSMNVLTMRSGNTVVTEYVPGQTYSLTLEMSVNPAKRGFDAEAFDASNQVVGTFSQIPNEGAKIIGTNATHNSV